MKVKMYIYMTENLINGKIYIGKHIQKSNRYYLGSGFVLQKAIKKYGKENFRKIILKEVSTEEELNELEKLCIISAKEKYTDRCYNIASGGNGGNLLKYASEETKEKKRKKQSELLRGNKNAKGLRHTEEAKKLMSETRKGKQTWWTGRKHTPETLTKISENSKKSKKVISYTIEGENAGIFKSAAQGAEFLRILGNTKASKTHVARACRTGIKAYGFRWKYVE